MPTTNAKAWFVSNQYSAESACEHCAGVIRHEPWCVTRSADVIYAYRAVLDASTLSQGDVLTLHALGVQWTDPACKGCRS